MNKQNAVWIAVLVLALLMGAAAWFLRPPHRSNGSATFGIGDPTATWSREVKYSVEGGGQIASAKTTATITFKDGRIIVEKSRVLWNDREVSPLPEDAKMVEVNYTGGLLTITADGASIYVARIGK